MIKRNQALIDDTVQQMRIVHKSAAKAELLAHRMQSESMQHEAEKQYEAFNKLHRVYFANTGQIWSKI